MNTYAVDFETFYSKEYSIKIQGAHGYVWDDRFNAYMVSIVGDDGTQFVGKPEDAPWEKMKGAVWVSHNAAFDELVYDELVIRGIIDNIEPADWWCTACLSVYLQGPRGLEGAAWQFLNKRVDKTVRAAQAGREATTEELNTDPELVEYALQDSVLCLELWERLSDQWPETERMISRLTYVWGNEGITINTELVDQATTHLTAIVEEALTEIPWAKEGKAPLSHQAAKKQAGIDGIPFPKSLAMNDTQATKWFETYSDQCPWIKAMRDYRRANMLLKKFTTVKERTFDDRLRYSLKYYGATTTGRFSGGGGFNCQNLPRGTLFDCNLRNCMVPDPGHVFIVADYAQVEVRTLADLAGSNDLLDKIRDGLNPYEAAAAQMLGMENPKGLKERDPDTYLMVKAMVLGCGFGMGPRNFKDMAPILTGGKFCPTANEASRAVNLYRAKNPEITNLWKRMGQEILRCIGKDFTITLPSGRDMRYFNVNRLGDKATVMTQRGGKREYFHGPKLVENCAQGYARDLLVDALLKVYMADLPGRIVLHVHDEIVYSAPQNQADDVAKQITAIMSKPPEWAENLPLEVEYSLEEKYTK